MNISRLFIHSLQRNNLFIIRTHHIITDNDYPIRRIALMTSLFKSRFKFNKTRVNYCPTPFRSLSSPLPNDSEKERIDYKITLNKLPLRYESISDEITNEDIDCLEDERVDPLSEELDRELLDRISPALPLSYNLAAYANKSETIQQLIKLGVNLATVEKRINAAQLILNLNFERDCKPYIQFLHDNGVDADSLGMFFTGNPMIFKEHLQDLHVRVNYLRSKRFSRDSIGKILTKTPRFINLPTKRLDAKLGQLQKEYQLSGNDIRQIVTKYPRIALIHDMQIREITFMLKEECGFTLDEIRQIILKLPIIWRKHHETMVHTFDFLHNDMQLSHELITRSPSALITRVRKLKPRHLYLQKLGRDQYDPTKPGYVPLMLFCILDDTTFCEKYSKTSVTDYNLFLKTI